MWRCPICEMYNEERDTACYVCGCTKQEAAAYEIVPPHPPKERPVAAAPPPAPSPAPSPPPRRPEEPTVSRADAPSREDASRHESDQADIDRIVEHISRIKDTELDKKRKIRWIVLIILALLICFLIVPEMVKLYQLS